MQANNEILSRDKFTLTCTLI